MKTVKIATIGDVVADIVTRFPAFPIQKDDFIPSDQLYLEAGGNANFLITAARLGGEAVALGSIGDDFWGKQVRKILEEEGVVTEYLSISGTSTVVQVLVDEEGEHAFVGKYGTGPDLEFDERTEQAIDRADALFCSGYSFADERMRGYSLESLHSAREKDVPIYFDAGPASFDLSRELISEILKMTNVLLLTEEELAAVSNGEVGEISRSGPELIVMKKGPGGCDLYLADGRTISASGFPVEVVDTTAAGDSFAAAFITARHQDWEREKCALFANAVGAAKVRKMGGGRNVPTVDEIREILNEFKVDIVI